MSLGTGVIQAFFPVQLLCGNPFTWPHHCLPNQKFTNVHYFKSKRSAFITYPLLQSSFVPHLLVTHHLREFYPQKNYKIRQYSTSCL